MKMQTTERGVTLIELLVTMAILTIVLAGIYTLIDSAYQTYYKTSAKIESQQTARTVLDYLVYRLREIDGTGTVPPGSSSASNPGVRNCTACHQFNMDRNPARDDPRIPCPQDVSIPRRTLYLQNLATVALPQLSGIDPAYQNMSGNAITFQADLLPIAGFPDAFTDANGNDTWDWTAGSVNDGDINGNGNYDPGETELLEDMNENSEFDYYAETWDLRLRQSAEGGYYELVESVDFSSLSDQKYNKSGIAYPGYTGAIIAYGLVGMSIQKIPLTFPTGRTRLGALSCGGGASQRDKCHGARSNQYNQAVGLAVLPNLTSVAKSTKPQNIYQNETLFDYDKFAETHPWWNIQGFSVEVTAMDTAKKSQENIVKLKQFVIPRNMEVNQ